MILYTKNIYMKIYFSIGHVFSILFLSLYAEKSVLNYSKMNFWCLLVLYMDSFNIRSGLYIMRE
jgi:hypothetical protein